MALTRMTAKNTFGEGLIMDFAPDNTQATLLTNALNATLLTNNGNEMSLQNDMGNGRVETAFLPDGYIPMGTCEFGGIIYIISYNPLDDLCLIGSFPSPERNITKEDRLNTALQPPSLNKEGFQEIKDGKPTGKLKALVSKVIIGENQLNPGDKYIITTQRNFNEKDLECLSFLENSDINKRVKLSIVSIEDSGKITKLNTTQYKILLGDKTAYYHIAQNAQLNSLVNTDIDAYRKTLLLNYNVFDSKIPGKLAILAELETVSSFSCGHKVITNTKNGVTTYDVYIDYKWESESEWINPSYLALTNFKWISLLKNNLYAIESENKILKIESNYVSTNIVHNESNAIENNIMEINLPYFVSLDVDENITQSICYPIDSDFFDATDIKDKQYVTSTYADHKRVMHFTNLQNSNESSQLIAGDNISNVQINNILGLSNTLHLFSISVPEKFENYAFKLPFKLEYEFAPAMDFGVLEHLAVSNEIDFSLIGTKLILPSGLKYYCSSDLCTLNISSEIYEEENHLITKMALEFYDPVGFCGTYFIEDRESYSGNQVINIPFNSIFLNQCQYSEPNTPKYHNSLEKMALDPDKDKIVTIKKADYNTSTKTYNCGDCGVLYSNRIYGVKLIYEYSELDPITLKPLPDKETITKGFWLYTNGLFNDFYYSVDDFRTILPKIPLQYGFLLKDKTHKDRQELNEKSLSLLYKLTNADYDDLQELNKASNELITKVDYSGDIDTEITVGLKPNPMYNLIKDLKGAPSVKIDLKLVNPYNSNESFAIYEQQDSEDSENPEDSESLDSEDTALLVPETYDYTGGSVKLTLASPVNKKDNNFSVTTSINVDIKNFPFTTIPTDFKRKMLNSDIVTPILYSMSGDDFNYEDVGGDKMFSRALCYVGSDDTSSDDVGRSDDRWYETTITDNGETVDSLLYEYPKGLYHTNLIDGHETLVLHYNGLGNRLPFTLFTIQRPEPDANSSVGYSTKWTVNTFGPGMVDTVSGDKYNYDITVTSPSPGSYIIKQASNGASEYSPNWKMRSYLPAFIDTRIANGGNSVLMSSSGGDEKKVLVTWSDNSVGPKQVIPYTAHTSEELSLRFYKLYLQTLKEIYTVNPDIRNCEVGTFSYNEENCKNVEIFTLLTASIKNFAELNSAIENIITLQEIPYLRYIKNIIKQVNSSGENLIKESDNNISLQFDPDLLGEETPALVTYINYTIPHNHELIDNYINNENQTIVLYKNGQYDLQSFLDKWVDEWSLEIIKVNSQVLNNKFYMLTINEKGEYGLKQLDSLNFVTNRQGNIYIKRSPDYSCSLSSTKYTCNKSPIFYNTSMCIEDFTWDVENKKHHFLFFNTRSLTQVIASYSYQLDDDAGDSGDYIITRPYLIGPSFNHILSY